MWLSDRDYRNHPAVRHAAVWEKISLALLLAVIFPLYAPAMGYQFVYDDLYQIIGNSHIHSWRFLPVYFTQNIWSQIPNNATNLYRPLFLVWLRLNDAIFHGESADWHFTTLLMHVLVTWLVYLLARVLLKRPVPALVAAAVFAVHPIHVEATAWISGVAEPLSGALLLGSLLCYLRLRSTPQYRTLWLGLSLTQFGAAMLVKETATVLPLLIAAYEYTLGTEEDKKQVSWGRFRSSVTPYAVVLIAYFVARTFATHGVLHTGAVPLRISLLSWPWLLCVYIGLVFWPTNLSPLYDFGYVDRLSSMHFILPVVAIAGGLITLWWWNRKAKSRTGAFLVLWFVITLAPAMAEFCLADAAQSYHDRYLYLPSVALALLTGAVVAGLKSKSVVQNLLAYGTVTALTVVLAVSTHHQLRYWESNYTLFERASTVAPNNEIAAGNFTVELIKRRDYRRALDLSARMVHLHPASQPLLRSAGQASFLLQDFPAAEHYYTEAVYLDPEQSALWLALGSTQMRRGEYPQAADSLRKALALSPQAAFFHYSLGLVLEHLGQWSAAKDEFAEELQLNCECSTNVARQALLDADQHLSRQPVPSVRVPTVPAQGHLLSVGDAHRSHD